jgi:hypothetical protein
MLKRIIIFFFSYLSLSFADINDLIDFGNPLLWCKGAFIEYAYEVKSDIALANFESKLISSVVISNEAISLISSTNTPMGTVNKEKKFDKTTGEPIDDSSNTDKIEIKIISENKTIFKFRDENLEVDYKKFKLTNKTKKSETIVELWMNNSFPFGGVLKLVAHDEKKNLFRKIKTDFNALLVDFNSGECAR